MSLSRAASPRQPRQTRDELYTIGAHGYLVYHEQAYGINLGFEPGSAPGLR